MRDNDRTPAGPADARHEDRILRFEREWQAGRPPALDDYLDPPGAPLDLLVELVHIDLEFRLKAGTAARAADYLARYPQLADDGEAAAELIAAEYELRRRSDPGLPFDAIADGYPRYRERLDALYRSGAGDAEKRAGKATLLAEMRAEHVRLKAGAWAGFSGYDAWFERANNASFGVLAAYNELVPQFERLFEREGRDFARFYAEVRRLAGLPKAERQATLRAL